MTRRIAGTLAAAAWLTLVPMAPSEATALDLPGSIPAPERSRLASVVAGAAIATRVDAEPFLASRDIFEFLLSHLPFTTQVIQSLRFARLRIWQTPEGLAIDEGWGTTGWLRVVYATDGRRVIYTRGQHQETLLPTIHGEILLIIDYHYVPGTQSRDLVKTNVTGFIKLDSRVLSGAIKLASPLVQQKADREARGLVKLLAKVSRAVWDDPAGVYAKLSERPDVSRAELAEFRALLARR